MVRDTAIFIRPGLLRVLVRRSRQDDRRRATVSRLGENDFRVTSSEPAWHWLQRYGAWVQGVDGGRQSTPSRRFLCKGRRRASVLNGVADGAVTKLGFFRLTAAKIAGADVIISRTGYTGDLGYEISQCATTTRSSCLPAPSSATGHAYGLEPAGLRRPWTSPAWKPAFILNGVDYYSALPLHDSVAAIHTDGIGLGLDGVNYGARLHWKRGTRARARVRADAQS